MNKIADWVFRGWPLFALVIIVPFCEVLLTRPCLEIGLPCFTRTEINRFLAFIFQVIGGGLVIYSIDSNIELLKGRKLPGLFCSWLKEFPLMPRKPVTIKKDGSTQISVKSSAKQRHHKRGITIEERMAYLQAQVDWLNEELEEVRAKFTKLLEDVKRESSATYSRLHRDHADLKENLESVAIGGLKHQVFGAVLLIYGSWKSLYG